MRQGNVYSRYIIVDNTIFYYERSDGNIYSTLLNGNSTPVKVTDSKIKGFFTYHNGYLYTYNFVQNTYANNLELKDAKFLSPKDLKTLVDSFFWGLGSNGYRLSYINVFDRYDNFLDQLDTYKFQLLSPYLMVSYP